MPPLLQGFLGNQTAVAAPTRGAYSAHRRSSADASGRMQVNVLKSKIHRAQVTAASLEYQGSLTIDRDLMDRAGLLPYERILCSNLANGERFETYAIPGTRGSGAIVLNGATAHLGKVGDRIIIMSFTWLDATEAAQWSPRVIVLGDGNAPVSERGT